MNFLLVALPVLLYMTSLFKARKPLPTLFFSHGGPTFIYKDDDFTELGAWNTVNRLGRKIKTQWKPDYIVVVSAHWQSHGSRLVEIARPSQGQIHELIYDFCGFPDYMYREKFVSKFDGELSSSLSSYLEAHDFHSQVVPRGIDHGVWVPFKVAFSSYNEKNRKQGSEIDDLASTPLLQVSLTGNETDFDTHFKLGRVLNDFKLEMLMKHNKQGLIICSGMTVHNLRDLGRAFAYPGTALPYVKPFHEVLKKTLVNNSTTLQRLNELKTRNASLLRAAHPTLEHFLPLVVACGLVSGSNEPITELYNAEQGSLGWGIYEFGKE